MLALSCSKDHIFFLTYVVMFFPFLHYTIFTFTLENQLLLLSCTSSLSLSLILQNVSILLAF